jgi:hypothetical protein
MGSADFPLNLRVAERPRLGPAVEPEFSLQRVRRCNNTRSLHMILNVAITVPGEQEQVFEMPLSAQRAQRAVAAGFAKLLSTG